VTTRARSTTSRPRSGTDPTVKGFLGARRPTGRKAPRKKNGEEPILADGFLADALERVVYCRTWDPDSVSLTPL